MSRQTYSPCPMFQLEALSPLQTVLQGASTIQKGSSMSSSTTSVACLVTYLLHTHEKDQSALSHDDKVVCGVLQSQPSFGSNWNLPSLIFGLYMHTCTLPQHRLYKLHMTCIYLTSDMHRDSIQSESVCILKCGNFKQSTYIEDLKS